MRRAGSHLVDYERELGSVIAEEDYVQRVVPTPDTTAFTPPPIIISPGREIPQAPLKRPVAGEERKLQSNFLFVRLRGEEAWVGFRDVLKVNGKGVELSADRGGRLDEFDETALEQWRRLGEASARYNLGRIVRTLNVPTFSLLVVRASHQPRFAFTFEREARVGTVRTCVVGYQESAAGTLVRNANGDDLPSSGNFWIDPLSGAVLRSELLGGNMPTGVAWRIIVSYSRDARLGSWVPSEMREEYVSSAGDHLLCVARYSNFQRFSVSSKIGPAR